MSAFNWIWLGLAVALPPMCSFGWHLLLRHSLGAFFAGWMCAGVCGVILGVLLPHDADWGTGSAISAAVCLIAWWLWRRKRRRNALSLAGYKARALLSALVRRVREATKPRPVLRPVSQGGAGWLR